MLHVLCRRKKWESCWEDVRYNKQSTTLWLNIAGPASCQVKELNDAGTVVTGAAAAVEQLLKLHPLLLWQQLPLL